MTELNPDLRVRPLMHEVDDAFPPGHVRVRIDAGAAGRDPRVARDVRGLGLLAAVELVKDRGTREKFAVDGEEVKTLNTLLVDKGLLTRATHIILLSPPLCALSCSCGSAGTSTCISMRSSSGPESLPR